MDSKKIYLIGALAVLAIVLAGSASAFDWSFLGGDSPETTTIAGIEFNIPDGYEIDDNYTMVNETTSSNGNTYVINGEAYENDAGEAIAIIVGDYEDFEVDDEILSAMGGEKKTINGQEGYLNEGDDDFTVFMYEVKGDLVTITVSDESVLEQIIIDNSGT